MTFKINFPLKTIEIIIIKHKHKNKLQFTQKKWQILFGKNFLQTKTLIILKKVSGALQPVYMNRIKDFLLNSISAIGYYDEPEKTLIHFVAKCQPNIIFMKHFQTFKL